MKRKYFWSAIVLVFSLFIVSCDKDDDEDLPVSNVEKGSIFPNKFQLKIIQKNDTSQHNTYTLYDTDGIGGANPQVLDTVIFPLDVNSSQATYLGELEFFTNNTSNNGGINSNATRYVICYREFDFFDLALNGRDNDINGNELGLNTEWIAKRRGATGYIKITMNYNQQPKDGTCNAGSRVFEGNIPFRVE